jgi:tRNA1Val (adenine37-N6)-methyltransferase
MSSSRSHNPCGPGERVDPFLDGRLQVIQSRDGYRFSVDALLLADFVTIRKGDRVVDLGTGCGIVALVLIRSRGAARVAALEIQEALASRAARNAEINGCRDRMPVVLGDLRRPPFKHGGFHVVVCNPPYRRSRSGRTNPDRERAVARHEILASLDDILRSARLLLRGKGRLALIYPAERLTDLLVRMRGLGLEPKRLQLAHPSLHAGAKLALVEAVLEGRPGVTVLPPILDQGGYSLENGVRS